MLDLTAHRLPPRPWTANDWDECGGYDCITPAIPIHDANGALVCTIDAKDHGWNDSGLGADVLRHRSAVRLRCEAIATAIIEGVQK